MFENHILAFGTASFGSKVSNGIYNSEDIKNAEIVIKTLSELNINYIDTANVYQNGLSERILGDLFKKDKSLRDKIVLQSKCGIKYSETNQVRYYDTSKKEIISAVEKSLIRLKTDRLDVLLLHRPDPLMDPEEVSLAYDELHTKGKVLNFGVSNFTPYQIQNLKNNFSFPIKVNQIQFNLLQTVILDSGIEGFQENINPHGVNGTLEYCKINNIRVQAWSPIIRGILTGGKIDESLSIALSSKGNLSRQISRTKKVLAKISKKYDTSPESILISWILKHPNKILPVLGSPEKNIIKACAEGINIHLSREDWFNLYRVARNQEIP